MERIAQDETLSEGVVKHRLLLGRLQKRAAAAVVRHGGHDLLMLQQVVGSGREQVLEIWWHLAYHGALNPVDTAHLEHEGPAIAVGELAGVERGDVVRKEHPADEGIGVVGAHVIPDGGDDSEQGCELLSNFVSLTDCKQLVRGRVRRDGGCELLSNFVSLTDCKQHI